MVKIIAAIKLYKKEKGRKTSFVNGYRPLFNFIETMKTSGHIVLLDRDNFFPGEEAEVEINFLNKAYLGDDLVEDKRFTFGEGQEVLGEGIVIKILSQ